MTRQFSYLVETIYVTTSDHLLNKRLNELGAEGWSLFKIEDAVRRGNGDAGFDKDDEYIARRCWFVRGEGVREPQMGRI